MKNKESIDLESMAIETIREKIFDEEKVVWVLVYDFTDVRKNSGKVRKFYRELKKSEEWTRKTDSELVFANFENALLIKELASSCGAKTRLYGGIEISTS